MSGLEKAVALAGGKVAGALPHPCAQCPWRLSNQGTEHPHGFYDADNIKRLWDGLRTGEAPGMSCHPTDSRMAEFSGYEGTAEREVMHECAGSLVMLAREFARFQAHTIDVEREMAEGVKVRAGEALRRYRKEAGRNGMTREGLSALTWLMVTGQTSLPGDPGRVNNDDVGIKLLPAWDTDVLVRSQKEAK